MKPNATAAMANTGKRATGISFTFPNGEVLSIGYLPKRKYPALYLWETKDKSVITPLAYFNKPEHVETAKRLLLKMASKP